VAVKRKSRHAPLGILIQNGQQVEARPECGRTFRRHERLEFLRWMGKKLPYQRVRLQQIDVRSHAFGIRSYRRPAIIRDRHEMNHLNGISPQEAALAAVMTKYRLPMVPNPRRRPGIHDAWLKCIFHEKHNHRAGCAIFD
jgi:hypothetical protein